MIDDAIKALCDNHLFQAHLFVYWNVIVIVFPINYY